MAVLLVVLKTMVELCVATGKRWFSLRPDLARLLFLTILSLTCIHEMRALA
jgi:hypothetical protein